jgi:hypothetical protein
MSKTLKDLPGSERFIEALIAAARDLSLGFAGSSDDSARASLQTYVDAIRLSVVEAIGEKPADLLLDRFSATVMGRKHEIENLGVGDARRWQ